MDRKRGLQERLLEFSREVLDLCEGFPNKPECNRIKGQLVGSASSIGANFEEADGAFSKKDFINKAAIARKEAKESRFFLRLIYGKYGDKERVYNAIKENEEIISILSSMIQKASKG